MYSVYWTGERADLIFRVVVQCWVTTPPSIVLLKSTVSIVLESSSWNLHPMAELVSVNTHTRDTVVLRNVILAYWTWLVPGLERREGERW